MRWLISRETPFPLSMDGRGERVGRGGDELGVVGGSGDGGGSPRIVVNGVTLGLELGGWCPACERGGVPIFVSPGGPMCARCYVGGA